MGLYETGINAWPLGSLTDFTLPLLPLMSSYTVSEPGNDLYKKYICFNTVNLVAVVSR